MMYRNVVMDDLVLLTLEGVVSPASWEVCFVGQERLFKMGDYQRLLIDGSALTGFDMTSAECMDVAPGFGSYARRCAFFSDQKLILGMMRIIHSCAFNEHFQVFKTREEASSFLAERNGSSQPA
jgi:hypothetical protein